jgi:uncharacterized membrane protein YfcA
MTITALIISSLVILAIAIPFSMAGQGGGSTYVPILAIAGMPLREASTTSLFIITIASISATLVFGRKKMVDWKMLLWLSPQAVLGSFAGGFVSRWVSIPVLTIIFACVLAIAAFFMLRPAIDGKRPEFVPRWFIWNRTDKDFAYEVPMGVLLPSVVIMGFIAGMIGIGGGLFLLPLLVLLLGYPMRYAIGISTTYVGITALPSFIGHLAGGDPFNIWIAIPLAVAAFLGARLGPVLSLRLKIPVLRIVLAIVLVALAVWMMIKICI